MEYTFEKRQQGIMEINDSNGRSTMLAPLYTVPRTYWTRKYIYNRGQGTFNVPIQQNNLEIQNNTISPSQRIMVEKGIWYCFLRKIAIRSNQGSRRNNL